MFPDSRGVVFPSPTLTAGCLALHLSVRYLTISKHGVSAISQKLKAQQVFVQKASCEG